MIQIKEGMKAPAFDGIDQEGREVKLSTFAGKKVILYFYPKDKK
ncbi:MAG TPA: redoxin domain-containing protein [Bacteroidales bacterium]|nr:redoxin domain-containing protein [Bacteroidales bacterium]